MLNLAGSLSAFNWGILNRPGCARLLLFLAFSKVFLARRSKTSLKRKESAPVPCINAASADAARASKGGQVSGAEELSFRYLRGRPEATTTNAAKEWIGLFA